MAMNIATKLLKKIQYTINIYAKHILHSNKNKRTKVVNS